MNRIYLWSIPIALAWLATKLIVAIARSGALTRVALFSSLTFLFIGVISAIVLIYLVSRTASYSQRLGTVFGYVLASPFAFIGGSLSSFFLAPLFGTLIFGLLPLILGAVIGYVISGWVNAQKIA